jgi:hypothetical protein
MRAAAARCAELGGGFLRWTVWVPSQNAYRFYEATGATHMNDETLMTLKGTAFRALLAASA